MYALKGLVLPQARHSDKIALASSRRVCYTLAAAPVLVAHVVVIAGKNKKFQQP